MRISEINIKNYLSFEDFKINLKESNNIIVGTNGVGKSNFLKIIYDSIYKKEINEDEKYKIEIKIELNNDQIKELEELFSLTNIIREIEGRPSNIKNIEKKDIEEYKNMVKKKKIFEKGIKYIYEQNKSEIKITNSDEINEYVLPNDNSEMKKELNKFVIEDTNKAIPKVKFYEKIDEKYKKILKKIETKNKKLNKKYDLDMKKTIEKYIQDNIKYISDNNGDEETKETLFEISCEDKEKFKEIQSLFKKITEKDFDIFRKKNEENGYEYKIIKEKNRYKCSRGESELINFLTNVYNDKILLIDEPCVHLSISNKITFRRIFMEEIEKDTERPQKIIITHDPDLINEKSCEYIIRFSLDENGKTRCNYIKNQTEKYRKMICEHKELLFSKKCLLVEGYSDYRVYKELLNINEIYDYTIIPIMGCETPLWKIMNMYEIPYKIIFDADKLYGKKDKKPNELNKNIQEERIDKLIKILLNEIIPFDYMTDNELLEILIKEMKILDETNSEIIKMNKYKIYVKKENIIKPLEVIKKIYEELGNNNQIEKELKEKILESMSKIKHVDSEIYNYALKSNILSKDEIIEKLKIKHDFCKLDDTKITQIMESLNKGKENELEEMLILKEFKKLKLMIGKEDINSEEMCELLNNKIYILDKKIKDLEGIGKDIFNDENFKKVDWNMKSNEEINKSLKNNKDNYRLNSIIKFINKEDIDITKRRKSLIRNIKKAISKYNKKNKNLDVKKKNSNTKKKNKINKKVIINDENNTNLKNCELCENVDDYELKKNNINYENICDDDYYLKDSTINKENLKNENNNEKNKKIIEDVDILGIEYLSEISV